MKNSGKTSNTADKKKDPGNVTRRWVLTGAASASMIGSSMMAVVSMDNKPTAIQAFKNKDTVLTPYPPEKGKMLNGQGEFDMDGFKLSPVRTMKAYATVLGVRTYKDEGINDLSRFDIAIGWGLMSNPKILGNMTIHMMERDYTWSFDGGPSIAEISILENTALLHIVPSEGAISRVLNGLTTGDLLTIHGRLVNVSGAEVDWRTDEYDPARGNPAREILHAQYVRIT